MTERLMTKRFVKFAMLAFAAAAGLLMFVGAGMTEELAPYAGRRVALAAARGTVYYTTNGAEFVVVATMDIGGRPLRFVTSLRSGQTTKISTPGGPGEPETAIEFSRDGDRLLVLEYGGQGRDGAPSTARQVDLDE